MAKRHNSDKQRRRPRWVHCNEGTDAAPAFGFATGCGKPFETAPNHIANTNSMQALDWDEDGDLDWLVCDGTCYPCW
jgi:hypothetical protein